LSIGNNGCEGSNSTTITVNPVPLVTASAQRTLMCRGESNTLTATGADTYSWSTSATTSVTVISPNSNITFNYTVTGSNANGCSNTAEVSVKVDACTGISESGVFSSLKIYPNPTHGLFMIQNPVKENTISVSVYDVVGNLVYTSSAITDGMTIDIQQQAKGLYFVHLIQNEKTVEIRKLIKN
jgi:hypothetical protein